MTIAEEFATRNFSRFILKMKYRLRTVLICFLQVFTGNGKLYLLSSSPTLPFPKVAGRTKTSSIRLLYSAMNYWRVDELRAWWTRDSFYSQVLADRELFVGPE
jgi:hypothetical protein